MDSLSEIVSGTSISSRRSNLQSGWLIGYVKIETIVCCLTLVDEENSIPYEH